MNTPILFLVFNRLDTTKEVFAAIKQAKPARLYIASDGARQDREKEQEKVDAVRIFVTENIDWECEVKTLFRDHNLGCRQAVSSAITWFFEQEEMGVILEDDCLPSPSFFPFCEQLLLQYKDDLRVWHIGGCNFFPSGKDEADTCFFSKYNYVWGWATWANRWKHYDVDIKSYSAFKAQNQIAKIWEEPKIQQYWLSNFEKIVSHEFDTWDYQWTYTIWKHQGLAVIPSKNLISNIGFGNDATHTKDANSLFGNIPFSKVFKFADIPKDVTPNKTYDKKFNAKFISQNLFTRISNKINRLLTIS